MALNPKEVTAVLVTRGDVELAQVTDSIREAGIRQIIVWNNARRMLDLKVFGRFLATVESSTRFVYTQDDDLIAPVADVLAAYDPETDREAVVANNRAEEEWRLLGIGSVFHRSLVNGCFGRYLDHHPLDLDFLRACDVVFAYQHPYRKVVLGYENLPWGYATAENPRMYGQPDHMAVRERVRERTLALVKNT